MPPAVSRFGPHNLSSPFAHLQQPHLQHHPAHAQTSATAGLPAAALGAHPSFAQAGSAANLNHFAPPTATNGLVGFGGGGGLAGGGGTGLASHAAQMGFAHGAALQQQQQQQQQAQDELGAGVADGKGVSKGRIREVWRSNLAQEMQIIRGLVEKYPYISMDTEFPGIVARPMGTFTTKADYHYQTLRCNVDLLKMIQLGITLFSPAGELPPAHAAELSTVNGSGYPNNLIQCPCTWQFNFQFTLHDDMYAQDSIEILQKAGIDFQLHEKNGIDPLEFGSLLITSGLVLLDDVHWVSFHSGYDFGYLVKIMLCKPLPDEEGEFRELLTTFFPSVYDIKFLLKHVAKAGAINNSPLTPAATQIITGLGQRSGLQDLADELGVKRTGSQHQAGSDSLLTGKIFWEMRRAIFNGHIDDGLMGQIWGLNGVGAPATSAVLGATTGSSFQGQSTPNMNGATIYLNGATPSTPNTGHVGLASTPVAHVQGTGGGIGALTPGGGGGVFGGFQFGK
ncbi:CAF1-domain-containing protein [Xylona heveae TC161]|uniref:poly(A)-specific ribonuclease n=1 Tax=Xylona heveae (strain CBS 132557 / TC161) TaxID=1328760 RepID=A0A164ZH79_XYLHT|nr:CAF1-domain-containing protein [Xylona heveae TC161]KZF19099.1 CAF1-domain-containing protein [Xylona heveae TC161]